MSMITLVQEAEHVANVNWECDRMHVTTRGQCWISFSCTASLPQLQCWGAQALVCCDWIF